MLNGMLAVLSWFYGAAVGLRNAAFDAGLLRRAGVGVPVISVGNMTAGGTGKTPLVEYIVRFLRERGERVAVVSRGYGRSTRGVVVVSKGDGASVDAAQGGDEPVQIAAKFPDTIVVVGERRVEAARTAVDRLGAGVVVMDDGFQHRYLRRDLDVVVVHGSRDLAAERLLPLGRRRENLPALRRAGFVVFSRISGGDAYREAVQRLETWYRGPSAAMCQEAEGVFSASGEAVDPQSLREGTGYAFCGIGEPEGFLATLRASGVRVAAHSWFPDHHPYEVKDIESVLAKAAEHGASFLITTEKDRHRLDGLGAAGFLFRSTPRAYVLRISARITAGEADLRGAIEQCLRRTGRQ